MASLHHFIIAASDRRATADFLVGMLELGGHYENGHFLSFQLADEVVVNVASAPPHAEIQPQHYAFLVDDDHFEPVRRRLDRDGVTYWADPTTTRPGEVATVNADGSGTRLYLLGPDGHYLEIITARYDDIPFVPGSAQPPE